MAETKELEDTREFQSAWRNAEIAVKKLLKDKPYLRDFEELFQLAHHSPYCPEVPKYIQEGTDWHQRVYSMGFDFGAKESLKIAGVEENQEGNPGRVRFDRASIASAIAAAKRLESEKDLYIFATYLGYTIESRPPPGMQQYVVVHPDGSTETVKPLRGNPMKTETERKSVHERIFGKGSIPPLERLRRGQTANELMPMSPKEGPPLPRMFALRWPWKK